MSGFDHRNRASSFRCGMVCAVALLLAASACTNRPPVLDPVPNQVVELGQSLHLQFSATDPDGDPLTFYGDRLPEGATLDRGGWLTWTPSLPYPRNYFFSVWVKDTGFPALTDTRNVMVSVIEPGSRDSFGTLKAVVKDAGTGRPRPARVRVTGSDGQPYGGRFEILHNTFFYTGGTFEASLPPGPATLAVFAGTEYVPLQATVDIPAAGTVEREFSLQRWVHMAEEGWYSGDVHLHQNYGLDFPVGTAPTDRLHNSARDVRTMVHAEDLNVANFLVSNSLGDGLFDLEEFEGRPSRLSDNRHILSWNQEFRSPIYGHLTLLNLKNLVMPASTGYGLSSNPYDYPTNAQIADRVHAQGGMVIYAHPAYFEDDFGSMVSPAARALAVDIALNKVDALEVMNNVSSDALSLALWYRVLNCGYTMPGVAGTDAFLNWVQRPFGHPAPGGNRVYVQLDGPLRYPDWIQGLRAGRSFMTNGPVVSLRVNGSGIGSHLQLASPASVSIQAEVRSHYPVDRLLIVLNGQTVFTQTAGADRQRIELDTTLELDRSGWLAARAEGDTFVHEIPGTPLAHTNPVYVIVDEGPIDSPQDRLYFVQRIDRLAHMLGIRDRFATEQDRSRVQAELQAARAIHETAAQATR